MSENEIEVARPAALQELTVDDAVSRFAKINELARRVLKEGPVEGTGDYGVVPGTKQKVLFKAGAEKLLTVFRIGADYAIERQDDDGGLVTYTVRCTLKHQGSGAVLGSALGLCSSKESKYRYRNAGRKCPKCGLETIIKGREEYGGGYLCFAKKGGCGAKFTDDDKSITSQQPGRVDNIDIFDLQNTVLKMAEKRALVAATLNVLGISGLFTQDLNEGDYDPARDERDSVKPQPKTVIEEPAQPAAMSPYKTAEAALYERFASQGIAGVSVLWRSAEFKALLAACSPDEKADLGMIKDELKGKAAE